MRSIREVLNPDLRGWNLGNALDCFHNVEGDGYGEEAWGNSKADPKVIDAVAEGGFNFIRIPVTWKEFMDEENRIAPERMDRVRLFVDRALDNGMTVDVNTHHENTWMFNAGAPLEQVLAKQRAIWQQICEAFHGYPDTLIFEGMNEPRIENGAPEEWQGGTPEVRQKINALNRNFVETVRSDPGHAQRSLLITTSGAVTTAAALEDLEIPGDPNVGVSLHIYIPHRFCFLEGAESDDIAWEPDAYPEYAECFDNIEKYMTSRDIPVALTEYGSIIRRSEKGQKEELLWAADFMKRAAKLHIPCVWWDNNYVDTKGDSFALIRREDCSWVRPELRDIITGKTR